MHVCAISVCVLVGVQAVIFLASHDEMGSAGFILNRPTSVQLGDLVEGNALPQFRKTPLYLGGDVGKCRLFDVFLCQAPVIFVPLKSWA